jgi:outer membrane protein assembly factor BamB
MFQTWSARLPETFDPGPITPEKPDPDLSKTRNVKWVTKLGSQSYGNVCVAGGKVFIGTNNEPPRDPRHQGDRSILMCLSEATGDFLWQLVVPKLESGKVNDWENAGILSAPTVEENRVYLVTSRCEVACLTTAGLAGGNVGPFKSEAQYIAGPGKPPIDPGAKDADIVWRYNMIKELGVFPHNGSCSAPLIVGDLVFAGTANGVDWTHLSIPAPQAPSLIALNKRTGELVAEDDTGISRRVFHATWGSPSTGKVGEKQLIFLGGGDGFCYALDAKPVTRNGIGYLPVVWKADCNPLSTRSKAVTLSAIPTRMGPAKSLARRCFGKTVSMLPPGKTPCRGKVWGT